MLKGTLHNENQDLSAPLRKAYHVYLIDGRLKGT